MAKFKRNIMALLLTIIICLALSAAGAAERSDVAADIVGSEVCTQTTK